MSDDWTLLIPEDPRFVPDEESQHQARARLAEIAPEADTIECMLHDRVEFFDCGQNFSRIVCPSCRSEIGLVWWSERMDADYSKGFQLASFPTPCCKAAHALHELDYEWPQGFGRFGLGAMNPGGDLKDRYKIELEEIIGTRLRVIYRRM